MNNILEIIKPYIEDLFDPETIFEMVPKQVEKKIPKTWSGVNYNFFWIVDYDEKGNPVGFDVVRQNFTGQYANVPNNDWGVAESLPANTLCKQWGIE